MKVHRQFLPTKHTIRCLLRVSVVVAILQNARGRRNSSLETAHISLQMLHKNESETFCLLKHSIIIHCGPPMLFSKDQSPGGTSGSSVQWNPVQHWPATLLSVSSVCKLVTLEFSMRCCRSLSFSRSCSMSLSLLSSCIWSSLRYVHSSANCCWWWKP